MNKIVEAQQKNDDIVSYAFRTFLCLCFLVLIQKMLDWGTWDI